MASPRAKIELLVRGADGADFETRKVESSVAYRQLRPQRIAAEQWQLAEAPRGMHAGPTFVLKNRLTEGYLRLTEAERFLWERMDGHTSLQDMATAYVLRFGSFDFDLIPALIGKLRQAELLTMRPASRLREVLSRHDRNPAARAAETLLKAIERLHVASRSAHALFERMYRRGAYLLFSPFAIAVLVVVGILGVRGGITLWGERSDVTAGLVAHPVVAILLVKVFFWLTVVSHQVVHALALVHYGRHVREFGFTMLHGLVPTFYADVTDIFMEGQRGRIVAALSGPLVHLFLGTCYLWIASLLEPGLVQGFLAASAILQLQSLFVSLYPFCFLEMDGYHIVVDLLGMPTLNRDAAHFVRHGLWRRLREGRWLTREEGVFVGYIGLSTVSVGAFIWLNIVLIAHAF